MNGSVATGRASGRSASLRTGADLRGGKGKGLEGHGPLEGLELQPEALQLRGDRRGGGVGTHS